MLIEKRTRIATDLIVQIMNLKEIKDGIDPNVFEKSFFDLNVDNRNDLSLTASQDVTHQLRFYEKEHGETQVNSLAVRLATADIKLNLEINTYGLSYLELYFVTRLNELLQSLQKDLVPITHSPHQIKLGYTVSFNAMRHYQNIGDNWTSQLIGNELIKQKEYQNDIEFLSYYSFTFSGTGDQLAAETVLRKVVSTPITENKTNNITIVKSMYMLSLLKLRHNDKPFKSEKEAEKLLNNAFTILNDPTVAFDSNNRQFSKIFNRNGFENCR